MDLFIIFSGLYILRKPAEGKAEGLIRERSEY